MSVLVLEDAEGVEQVPATALDGYVQILRDGVEFDPDRELKERGVFTGTLADADPRLGMRTAKGAMGAECRGNGIEGLPPDCHAGILSLLPSTNFGADRVVSGITHTDTVINLNADDSDIDRFRRGDCIVVLVPGAYHPCAITAVDKTPGANNITVMPPLPSGNFPDLVELSKFRSYQGADAGHPSLTAHYYWGSGAEGGGVHDAILGARTNTMALEKFQTGELPSLKFGFEGLTYLLPEEGTDAPHDPQFDPGLPSVVLGSYIYKDGVAVDMDGMTLTVEQPLTFLKSTASENGRFTGRASGTRKIAGTIAPYTNGEDVSIFENWENGTKFSLFAFTAKPDPTNGILLGSVVMFFMPNCFIKKPTHKDVDGVMTDNIDFMATGGPTGQDMDFSISFV